METKQVFLSKPNRVTQGFKMLGCSTHNLFQKKHLAQSRPCQESKSHLIIHVIGLILQDLLALMCFKHGVTGSFIVKQQTAMCLIFFSKTSLSDSVTHTTYKVAHIYSCPCSGRLSHKYVYSCPCSGRLSHIYIPVPVVKGSGQLRQDCPRAVLAESYV